MAKHNVCMVNLGGVFEWSSRVSPTYALPHIHFVKRGIFFEGYTSHVTILASTRTTGYWAHPHETITPI